MEDGSVKRGNNTSLFPCNKPKNNFKIFIYFIISFINSKIIIIFKMYENNISFEEKRIRQKENKKTSV